MHFLSLNASVRELNENQGQTAPDKRGVETELSIILHLFNLCVSRGRRVLLNVDVNVKSPY